MSLVNPDILTYDQLQTATQIQIQAAQYQLELAAFSLFSAVVIYYFVHKVVVWIIPHYWNKPKADKVKD